MYSSTLSMLFLQAVTDNYTFWCHFKNRILCFDLRLSEPESVFSCYKEQQVQLKRILHLFWQYSILSLNKRSYTPPSGREPLPLSLPADIWSCLFEPPACSWCALCVNVHTRRNSLLLSLCHSQAYLTLHRIILLFLIVPCLRVIKIVFIEQQMERWSVAAAITSVCVFVRPYSQSTRAVKYSVCLMCVFQ